MRRDRRGRYKGGYGDVLIEHKEKGIRMGAGRPAAPCVSCGKRQRELPYTQCHPCRMPALRAGSQKGWRIRKMMEKAREQYRE